MKIAVLIPSRGRATLLQSAVTGLCQRASWKHDIEIAVGCDADDPLTIGMAHILKLRGWPVTAHVAQRSASLGAIVDRLAALHPADVYCSLCDDVVPVTPNWDERIFEAWRARDAGVWWWGNARSTYAIVSEKWRQAAGRIFTDLFPFWGDDIYLLQVWRYASGEPMLKIPATLEDIAQTRTTRMRDLREWIDFFWSLQGRRLSEGQAIARRLGWPVRDRPAIDLVPSPEFAKRIDVIEATQGDQFPPTPEYLGIRARAQALMAA